MGDIPVTCGWCGAELEGLGDNGHTCQEQANVARFLATGEVAELKRGGLGD